MLDTAGFGADASALDPERFARTSNKNLERSPYYRPFGGGRTLCSGRYVARREVLAFLAAMLWRYDLRAVSERERVLGVEGKAFPRADVAKPSLGIAMPVAGDDMVVRVRPRS